MAHESRQLMYGWMDTHLKPPAATQTRRVVGESPTGCPSCAAAGSIRGQPGDHLGAGDLRIGQPFIAAEVLVREFVVIESQLSQ